ncbi:sugar phosphate isomerase/epimerase [Bacillus sp. APMAM]|nr:sugar phosphate isomerase/epimerase [Bacillus sp. APMAM]RTZ54177.1 sugar phosphate isomerase/epimerase [Bacillus sp. SAJ1]
MTKIPVALQMYSLRNEGERDFVGTLEKVAKLGFAGVEFAGYGGMEATQLKEVLDDLGLKAASSHVPLDVLENQLSDVIRYQQTIENSHIVCPFLMPDQRNQDAYARLIQTLNQVGEECHKEGITFSYHNHDFELVTLANGLKPLEWILNETNPEWVKAEFDVYWLTKAGEEPTEWLKRYKGRTPLVHLKDMTKDEEQFFAELGTGGVDIEAILALGDDCDVEWWIVEQDASKRPPLESIEMSSRYLKQKGIL